MTTFFRIFTFAFQNFARNAWLTAATVSVLALTLVSVNVLLALNVLGKVALTTVREKIDVSVHFKPETDESRVQTARIFLLSLPEVKDVTYISPAEALTSFSENYKNDPEVLSSLAEIEENPFGATLVIQARSLEDYPKVMQALSDPLYADIVEAKDYDDRQAMIAKVESVSDRIVYFGLLVSGVFAAITLLMLFNTIRMSIYTRREEIGIMRLVGASDAIIRTPFYVEAALWSALALVIALAVTLPAVQFAEPYLSGFFGTGSVDLLGFYKANAFTVIGGQFFGATLVAVLTTKIAISKYLKV